MNRSFNKSRPCISIHVVLQLPLQLTFLFTLRCARIKHRPMHSLGPSIKYITLFLANFDHPYLCHTSRDTLPESTSHISDPPPLFSRPSTKIPDKSPLYKFSLNCSRRFLSGGFVRVGFCPFPFCYCIGKTLINTCSPDVARLNETRP